MGSIINMPLFSVVIPAYNREKVLERTVNSALSQTYPNIEIIIVDDGSTDDTGKVAKLMAERDPRINFISQENGGACSARNTGLKKAKGKYILFLDSDDEIMDTFLEKAELEYRKDSELGAVYCQTGIRKNNGIDYARKDHLEGYIYADALKQGYITSTSFITMKTECVRNVWGWDEYLSHSNDDDMCFRLAKKNKFKLIDEILGIYNTDSGNNLMMSFEKVAIGFWKLWNKYEEDTIKYCGKETINNHYKECLDRFVICHNRMYINMCREKIKYFSRPKQYFPVFFESEIKYNKQVLHRIIRGQKGNAEQK